MYHMMSAVERETEQANQQFYDSLPSLVDMPAKPKRDQAPYTNEHPPSHAVIQAARAYLLEAFNCSADVRM